ncbi:hypothetical protein GF325_15870, partial [Candidatus Bathyarchaeota archaeon]|nr:hypothetical protein [Candidatus Bathyarchaeota archaeon]
MEPEGKLVIVAPGEFDVVNHFYPRVLNAQLHPVMRYFFNFTRDRIISRYHHLHPFVDVDKLEELVTYQPSFFRWVGSDLFAVTTGDGFRHMMVIETNSCPSGQKSTPFIEEMDQGGYFHLMSKTFAPLIESVDEKAGGLAVIYDKNFMEASGYASAMADLSGEQVFLVRMPRGDSDPITRFTSDGVLEVKSLDGEWLPMRAAFRYVTQSPWDRIPLKTKTMILNPIIACLSGGRNKLVASKAYDLLNSELIGTGLKIRTPETIWDVSIAEVPLWIKRMGGIGVVKNPYSNAGQGVWTITNTRDCDKFRQASHQYSKFIVQKLIGNSTWH